MKTGLFFLSFILVTMTFNQILSDLNQIEEELFIVIKYRQHAKEAYTPLPLSLLAIFLKNQPLPDPIFLRNHFLNANALEQEAVDAITEFRPLQIVKDDNIYKISLDDYDLCFLKFEQDIELINVFITSGIIEISMTEPQQTHNIQHKSYDESTIDTLIDDLNQDGVFDHHTGPVAPSGVKGFFIKLGVNLLYYSHKIGMVILNKLHFKRA